MPTSWPPRISATAGGVLAIQRFDDGRWVPQEGFSDYRKHQPTVLHAKFLKRPASTSRWTI